MSDLKPMPPILDAHVRAFIRFAIYYAVVCACLWMTAQTVGAFARLFGR